MTSQLRGEIAKVLQDHHNTEKSKTNTHPYYDCPSCLDQIMSAIESLVPEEKESEEPPHPYADGFVDGHNSCRQAMLDKLKDTNGVKDDG